MQYGKLKSQKRNSNNVINTDTLVPIQVISKYETISTGAACGNNLVI